MTKQTLHIPDMHCPACVMHLEALEDELPGILRIKGSYQKQQLEVEYDEAMISAMEIVEAVQGLGYQVG